MLFFQSYYKFCAFQKNYYRSLLIFSQFAPIYVPRNIENASAQVSSCLLNSYETSQHEYIFNTRIVPLHYKSLAVKLTTNLPNHP